MKPNRRFSRFPFIILSMALVATLAGCSEYWWTRGQAPGVEQMISKADERLSQALKEDKYKRATFAPVAKELSAALSNTYQAAQDGKDASAALSNALNKMQGLEGKISVTSRAPYGELAGQLRAFLAHNSQNKSIDASAFGLFTARTKAFLAVEMEVPAPSFGA